MCTSEACRPKPPEVKRQDSGVRNAQLSGDERPIVWYHEGTGEVRYPGRNDGDMPQYYKDRGYSRKEFGSYFEHQKFCREQGVINHKAEGITDSRYKLGALNDDRG